MKKCTLSRMIAIPLVAVAFSCVASDIYAYGGYGSYGGYQSYGNYQPYSGSYGASNSYSSNPLYSEGNVGGMTGMTPSYYQGSPCGFRGCGNGNGAYAGNPNAAYSSNSMMNNGGCFAQPNYYSNMSTMPTSAGYAQNPSCGSYSAQPSNAMNYGGGYSAQPSNAMNYGGGYSAQPTNAMNYNGNYSNIPNSSNWNMPSSSANFPAYSSQGYGYSSMYNSQNPGSQSFGNNAMNANTNYSSNPLNSGRYSGVTTPGNANYMGSK